MKRVVAGCFVVAVTTLLCAAPFHACRRLEPVSVRDMVARADLIVRATAVEYSEQPVDPSIQDFGAPDSVIRFRIEEVLKGDPPQESFHLPGFLVEVDDYNDHDPPYQFVRRGGRKGNCYAHNYRKGGQFLFFLRRTEHGYTTHWDPLAPVNEQLRSVDDTWTRYVKARLRESGYKKETENRYSEEDDLAKR